ncbi:hypothetical protein D9758_017351 [Tetrapyrgos nigripes]|uniref:WD40 repeat-like protein n=1 Tax=Tetrapyrgos nigripes TaxID=182062 RepID=A0A8H5C473_9AGAR|nr:hypothetical protein D9758_017351 [Tetrapyrgos nigripes]
MEKFLQKKILFWIEAMNLMGKMSECIRTLDLVLKRGQFQEIEQRQHILQCRDMANVFALSVVKEMTPHLYLSILPFYPAISKSFGKQVKVNTEIKCSQSVGFWDTGSEVKGISVSPDGTRIVSGSEDGTVRIWDAQTGTAIGEPLRGHQDWVQSVAFSPDGARIVSGSDDRTVRIWDAQTGTAIGEPLQGHEHSVQSVAFSPDGARIVSGSGDFTVRIWDAQTGTAIGEPLQGYEYWVQSVAFSPDGARTVSGSDDRTGEPLQGHQNFVQSVAFSSSGAQILSGSSDRAVTNPSTGHTLSCKYNNWTIDKDGWIQFPGIHCGIIWIQPQYCPTLCTPQNLVIISRKGCTKLSFDEVVYGKDWAQCFTDK